MSHKLGLEKEELTDLLVAVKEKKGIDLNNYAWPSLRRRILRFLDLKKVSGIDELLKRIIAEKGFDDLFINEITVGVTEMFRNPSFWKALREDVLPALKSKPVINIWHAGCSMGEEVYSMAVLLDEMGLLYKSRITATDINLRSLEHARTGVYQIKNQSANATNYSESCGMKELADYYTVEGDSVRFDERLIKRVEFKRHDLSAEGAFGVFDLILCRNVFIYFNLDLQEKVLELFNQSLEKGSFLGIGSKESIRWCRGANLFEVYNLVENLYRRIR